MKALDKIRINLAKIILGNAGDIAAEKRRVEHALRAAGHSRKDALKIVSERYRKQ